MVLDLKFKIIQDFFFESRYFYHSIQGSFVLSNYYAKVLFANSFAIWYFSILQVNLPLFYHFQLYNVKILLLPRRITLREETYVILTFVALILPDVQILMMHSIAGSLKMVTLRYEMFLLHYSLQILFSCRPFFGI